MAMDPGKLDRRVTLQTRTVTQGSAGGSVVTWADGDSIWAQKIQLNTSEARAAGALRPETTLILRIRYRSTLTANGRLYFEGRYYEVNGDPVEEGRRESQVVQARYVEGAQA